MKPQNFDVAVIGAGITGLLLTKKLSEMGFSVILLEKNSEIAKSSSTRNEGWLHRGTYHTYAINSLRTALEVGKKCIYGYEQIQNDFPYCIEEPLIDTIAVLKKEAHYNRATKRWKKNDVISEEINFTRASALLPEVNIERNWAYFKVKEKSINTRMLLHGIFAKIKSNPKATVITGVESIDFINDNTFLAKNEDDYTFVKANFIVYAAGYGTKELFRKEFSMDLPLRKFSAQLLLSPRLSQHNVFFLDEGEITAMNHGSITIVGSTKDNYQDIYSDEELNEQRKLKLITKTHELFKKVPVELVTYPCHKVDWKVKSKYPSLDAHIAEPRQNHFVALPGKMTETPWLCDNLIQEIFRRSEISKVAQRPCDEFQQRINELMHEY